MKIMDTVISALLWARDRLRLHAGVETKGFIIHYTVRSKEVLNAWEEDESWMSRTEYASDLLSRAGKVGHFPEFEKGAPPFPTEEIAWLYAKYFAEGTIGCYCNMHVRTVEGALAETGNMEPFHKMFNDDAMVRIYHLKSGTEVMLNGEWCRLGEWKNEDDREWNHVRVPVVRIADGESSAWPNDTIVDSVGHACVKEQIDEAVHR